MDSQTVQMDNKLRLIRFQKLDKPIFTPTTKAEVGPGLASVSAYTRSIHLSIYLSICLSIHVSIYLASYLPIHRSIHRSICIYIYIYNMYILYIHTHNYSISIYIYICSNRHCCQRIIQYIYIYIYIYTLTRETGSRLRPPLKPKFRSF